MLPPIKELLQNVIKGNRAALAQAITLLESRSIVKSSIQKKMDFLRYLHEAHYQMRPDSVRIGITGSPGCGKSTFIEAFGMSLINDHKRRLAVLAVDPTSAIRGGSILADKTRMPNLTRNANAYVRPSPSRLHLGGATQATGGTILLCECAGYDVVIVETVGVGQSEFEVAHLCDVFTLLVPPSAGDELQAIKKGIVEMANIIVVTKYDGDLINAARRMRGEIRSATKFVEQSERPTVHCASSKTGEGVAEVWKLIYEYLGENGQMKLQRRQDKKVKLLKIEIINELFELFSRNLSYEDYEMRLKEDPKLPVYNLVEEILYKELPRILKISREE